MILDWRTSERITKYMITDIEYSMENQERWIADSYNKKDYYHWIIQIDSKPAGMIYVFNFSHEFNKTFWGYYLGDDKYSGIGGLIPPFLYNWLFNDAGINETYSETLYFNINVIKLHNMQGCSFAPSLDRVIIKRGEEVLLVSQTLGKEKWQSLKRYQAMVADFPTKKWLYAPGALTS